MLFSTSEIKVALLGNVSAGKTTVLNALFRDKYGEVSMKRTTAGVNYFRIVTPGKDPSGNDKTEGENKEAVEESTENKAHGNIEEAEEPRCPDAGESRTAKSTLEEITEDNKILRETNEVKEKWFDIELDEHLMEMRKDTNLVVVDVPGINEAGACSKYKDYVNAKWHTFDCVVAVMDGKQGVNTEDQVYLLNLIRANNAEIMEIPIVVLFNKVDDPEDQEQAGLIREAKEEIYRIFVTTPPTPSKAGFAFSQAPIFQSPPVAANTAVFAPTNGPSESVPFVPTTRQNEDETYSIHMQSISAMSQYEQKSFEELRYEQYRPNEVSTVPKIGFGGSGFAGPSSAPIEFESPGGFGRGAKAYSGFGAAANTGSGGRRFGASTRGFGSGTKAPKGFGAAQRNIFGGSGFGASVTPTAFGSPAPTTGFGGSGFVAAPPSTAFNSPAANGGFSFGDGASIPTFGASVLPPGGFSFDGAARTGTTVQGLSFGTSTELNFSGGNTVSPEVGAVSGGGKLCLVVGILIVIVHPNFPSRQ